MRFADPLWLLLLLPTAGYVWWRGRTKRRPSSYIAVPSLASFGGLPPDRRTRWLKLPAALRAGSVALLILALARPQRADEVRDVRTRGRNIILTLDISSSMKAADFPPGNRLDAAKRVLAGFVGARGRDLIGLVIFAGQAFTQAPLTNDREVLLDLLDRVDIGLLPDGTAIGTALAMSENHVKDLPRQSSVIVLITDGANNTGTPDPLTAAAAARALGTRIYAIGVSSYDTAAARIRGTQSSEGRSGGVAERLSSTDEQTLRTMATATGGQYFRAADPRALSRVTKEIDRLEQTELRLREVRSYRELYPLLLVPALLLLAAELLLRSTRLRTLP